MGSWVNIVPQFDLTLPSPSPSPIPLALLEFSLILTTPSLRKSGIRPCLAIGT